jgi:DNA (cytosine-5)-methyltransferase 1
MNPTIYSILEAGKRCGRRADKRDGIGIADGEQPMFTLQAGAQHAIAFSCKDSGQDAADISPTLRAMEGERDNGGGQVAVAFGGNNPSMIVNALTSSNGGPDDNKAQAGLYVVEGDSAASTPELPSLRSGCSGVQNAIAFTCKDDGGDAADVSPTLRAMNGERNNGGGQVAIAFAENQQGEIRTADVVTSLNTGGGKPGQGYPDVCHTLRGEGFDASEDGTGRGTPLVPAAGFLPDKGEKAHGLGYEVEQSPTLRTETRIGLQVGTAIRRLMPVECERLMGLPDHYTKIPWRGKPAEKCPDGPRYRAIGNSMAVPVIRYLGDRIQLVEDITS